MNNIIMIVVLGINKSCVHLVAIDFAEHKVNSSTANVYF